MRIIVGNVFGGGQLLSLALNHVTAPSASFEALIDLAIDTGCSGVEVRNDLSAPLFSGMSATRAGTYARERGVRIIGLAQLSEFNRFTTNKKSEAQQLIQQAVDCGADTICLIPCNDGKDCEQQTRAKNLRSALEELAPLLRAAAVVGLVEPLGFSTASIRNKSEVVDAINELDVNDCFKLVHDTFHHFLAGGGTIYPQHTGVIHVSGVTDKSISPKNLTDSFRGLVNGNDLLDNVGQLRAMIDGGYTGSISMEAFDKQVHQLPDLAVQLRDSYDFINSGLAAVVA